MSGRLVLVICAFGVLILGILVGPGYFLCGLLQGCPGAQGRSSLAYALEPLLGYELGIRTAHLVDVTPFMITLAIGVIAALLVKKRNEDKKFNAVLAASSAENRCDGCNETFPRFDYLTKVEGRGFLCKKCRS